MPSLLNDHLFIAKVDALGQLKQAFSEYIKTRGTAIMMDEEKVSSFAFLTCSVRTLLVV